MSIPFQLTIDCINADRLARFWADAIGYVPAPPPPGFDDWAGWYRSVGVPEEEVEDLGIDRLVDPDGSGPPLWFQQVPEEKAVKNRLHIDVLVGGGRARSLEERRTTVDAEVERLIGLGATVARVLSTEGVDHYAVTMYDPEGNEFCVV